MNKLLLLAISLLLFSCSPAMYKAESNPVGKALLDGSTEVTLINKTNQAVVFYVVNVAHQDSGLSVSVPAKSKEVITSFECGRYNIFVKDQMLKSIFIQLNFKNKLTYEIRRN